MRTETRAHGSSGATITVDRDTGIATKTGNPRVLAQGEWLLQHGSPAVPRVFHLQITSAPRTKVEQGYVMEVLEEPPRDAVYGAGVLERMVGLLDRYVWSQPAEVAFDLHAHMQKIAFLAHDLLEGRQFVKLLNMAANIRWDELPRCLSHGDPTVDNLMLRRVDDLEFEPSAEVLRPGHPGYELVMIDPVPAVPAVPDLRCVDLAKIMQSVYGWERMRYGEPGVVVPFEALDFAYTDRNERLATEYWTNVHLLRTFHYVSEEVRDALRNNPPLCYL